MSEAEGCAGEAPVALAELRAMWRSLEAEAGRHWALLEALEARKTRLDQEGAARHSLREQQALARQVSNLDRQAEQEVHLLRLIGKQQRLLGLLIAACEDVEQWQALRARAPAAVELGWGDLVEAAGDVMGAEARLDGILRVLGVPEEEWPQAGPPLLADGPVPSIERGVEGAIPVAEVLDGRSIRLSSGETVRYIGVDAPLLRVVLVRPEIGADEAWQANRRLAEGRSVRLEADAQDRDPQGALWRYVWVGSTCINAELIRQGAAYHRPLSPNQRHAEWFARLEAEARRRKRGVWG